MSQLDTLNRQQWRIESLIGPLYLVASEAGLHSVHWEKFDVPPAASLQGADPIIKILAQAVRELEEYFAGTRQVFAVPVATEGTEFQKQVWRQLSRIPYGKTASYSEVARRIKKDKAVRAVGSANGKNPLCVVVPCHRVIAADGSLGGYSGGLSIKTKLLRLEGHLL